MVNGLDIVSYVLGKKSASGSGNLLLCEWDFTSETPLVDKVRGKTITASGISFDSNGAVFDASTDRLLLGNLYYNGIIITIDFAAMSLTSNINRRCIMGTQSEGLCYRNTGVWGFYANSQWEDTSETDGKFFEGSKVKIFVDLDGYWHIYKNDELWFEPKLTLGVPNFQIGSSGGSSMYDATVKSLKIEFLESGI